MATISIILPAYNAEQTLIETIESVQNQTYSDWELIAIDDGSTDHTLNLLKEIPDPRIQVFSYANGGVSMARNRGITHATGDYIAFLDADDLWTEDKLELQLAALKNNPQAGVAYSWVVYFNPERETQYPSIPLHFEGNVYGDLLLTNFLANGSNPLITREAVASVGEFDSTFPHCADWDYYLRLADECHFVVVPKHQVFYRQSSGSMSSKVDDIEHQLLTMFEKHFTTISPVEYHRLQPQSLASVYQYCAHKYLEYERDRTDVDKAVQKLSKAIRLHPPTFFNDYSRSLVRWLVKRWIVTRISPRPQASTLS